MKLFKKAMAIATLTVMSLSMTACGTSGNATQSEAQQVSEDVVAKVDNIIIDKVTLNNQLSMYGMTEQMMQMYYGADYTSNAEVVAQFNAFKDNVVNSLVEAEVLVLQAKSMKDITVTEDEINEELEATKAQFPSEEDFNTALKETGLTLEQLKESIEKNLYVTKLIAYYKENEVNVTDEEIKNYYNEHIAEYTKAPGANVYHILVDTEEKAQEVLDKYNAGTSFADLAAEYGTDGTSTQGGALGFIEYDTTQYDADFMAGAKALGEGEVSKPVKTQFGWHIIKVDGVQKEEKVQPLDEVKDAIRTTLEDEKVDAILSENLPKWKEEHTIITYPEHYQTQVTKAAETSDETQEESSQETSDDTAKTNESNKETQEKSASNEEVSANTEASTNATE